MDRQEKEAEMVEEMLLAALHVFKVPDADILVHLGDGPPEVRVQGLAQNGYQPMLLACCHC